MYGQMVSREVCSSSMSPGGSQDTAIRVTTGNRQRSANKKDEPAAVIIHSVSQASGKREFISRDRGWRIASAFHAADQGGRKGLLLLILGESVRTMHCPQELSGALLSSCVRARGPESLDETRRRSLPTIIVPLRVHSRPSLARCGAVSSLLYAKSHASAYELAYVRSDLPADPPDQPPDRKSLIFRTLLSTTYYQMA